MSDYKCTTTLMPRIVTWLHAIFGLLFKTMMIKNTVSQQEKARTLSDQIKKIFNLSRITKNLIGSYSLIAQVASVSGFFFTTKKNSDVTITR